MSVIEQEIFSRVQQLDENQKLRVLEYVRNLDIVGSVSKLSAREMTMLPVNERQRLMTASLTLAQEEDFEHFDNCSSCLTT